LRTVVQHVWNANDPIYAHYLERYGIDKKDLTDHFGEGLCMIRILADDPIAYPSLLIKLLRRRSI